MKKCELKNYATHKTVEIHEVKVAGEVTYVAWYSCLGKLDYNPHGITGCNKGAVYYIDEAEAIKNAVQYISEKS